MTQLFINKTNVRKIKYKPDADIIFTHDNQFYVCVKNSITDDGSVLKFYLKESERNGKY